MSTLAEKALYSGTYPDDQEALKSTAALAIDAGLQTAFDAFIVAGGKFDQFAFPISNAPESGDPIVDVGDQGISFVVA